jgi:iron(III) transport system substrate-binding protein
LNYRRFKIGAFLIVCSLHLTVFSALAASPSPSLAKAKQEAEAKGFTFVSSRDEIIRNAKSEGKVSVLMSMSASNFQPIIDSFKKKYPFIKDVRIQEITGSDSFQAFLLGLKAGTVKEWDVGDAATDWYNDFPPYAMKLDLLGMASEKVLAIDPRMVDPDHRTLVSIASTVASAAYNKNLIAADKVPNTWDDFLKPEFKGKKFAVNVRPLNMPSLMAGLGEEWGVNYARKTKDQDPIWGLGEARLMTSLSVGEIALFQITNYNSCARAAQKDPSKSIVCKIIEPVPVRLHEMEFVIKGAAHPYSALLFLEHQVSAEVQRIIDQQEPLKSSLYANGEIAKLVKGKKTSVHDFKTYQHTAKWVEMIVDAYGFPRPQIK